MTTTAREDLDAHQATVETPVGFTPGPWEALGPNWETQWSIVSAQYNEAGERAVAGIGWIGRPKPECEANAKLIAMAPDLLAERNRLREALEGYVDKDAIAPEDCPYCEGVGEVDAHISGNQTDYIPCPSCAHYERSERAREALGTKQP